MGCHHLMLSIMINRCETHIMGHLRHGWLLPSNLPVAYRLRAFSFCYHLDFAHCLPRPKPKINRLLPARLWIRFSPRCTRLLIAIVFLCACAWRSIYIGISQLSGEIFPSRDGLPVEENECSCTLCTSTCLNEDDPAEYADSTIITAAYLRAIAAGH